MSQVNQVDEAEFDDDGIDLSEVLSALLDRWKLIVGGGLLAGCLGFGVASLIPPTFTARTVLMPPQQQQSSAAAALSSLGALAGIAGGAAGIKSPADQYVALMQSARVTDRIIDQFKLLEVYKKDFRVDARKALAGRSVIVSGKKDGLITVDVSDRDPRLAANIANAYVEGLRQLMTSLAVTEAQQRRVFFEQKLSDAKDRLTQAQIALQASGFNPGALKAEPKAAADSYAKLRAEAMSADVKLQSMRRMLADNAPEVQQQQALLGALRAELARLERRDDPGQSSANGGADYITKYREFKYQETLFDLFARQYEAARVDESREGALIQVVDVATPPERKSKPKRATIALATAVLAGLLLCAFVLFRHFRRPADGVAPGST